jgi:hypothetical protein
MLTLTLARRAATACIVTLLTACSSMHAYEQTAPDNMLVTTDIRSGSARMHIYETDGHCTENYLGTVDLPDNGKTKLGTPAGKPIALAFDFYGGSAYFTGAHSISYDTYLTPRAGHHYEIQVSYVDKMYGATVYEQDGHGGRHKVARVEPECSSK